MAAFILTLSLANSLIMNSSLMALVGGSLSTGGGLCGSIFFLFTSGTNLIWQSEGGLLSLLLLFSTLLRSSSGLLPWLQVLAASAFAAARAADLRF